MRDFNAYRSVGGTHRKSAGLPNPNNPGGTGLRMEGVLLRGVVLSTYVQIDGNAFPASTFARVSGVYCDVLVASTMEGVQGMVLQRVLVSQAYGGLHEGQIWKPRAARQDFARGTIDPSVSQPNDLDGDHVLVAFIDDSATQPVIIRALPHPRVGEGGDDLNLGGRMRLANADGEPSFWKHRGAVYGVDTQGNFELDTTRAHSGEYSSTGSEVPATDADHGNVSIFVSRVGTFTVRGVDPVHQNPTYQLSMVDGLVELGLEDAGTKIAIEDGSVSAAIDGGAAFSATGKDAAATLTVGSGDASAAIVERLEILWNQTKIAVDAWQAHTHPDGFGSTGPAAIPPNFPAWDPNIRSTRLKFPSG